MEKYEEWFKELEPDWKEISTYNGKELFNSFKSLEQLITQEVHFWNKYTEGNLTGFKNTSVNMLQYCNDINHGDLNKKEFIQKMGDLFRILKSDRYLFSYTERAQMLVRLYDRHPDQGNAAYQVLFNQRITPNLNRIQSFLGVLEALDSIRRENQNHKIRTDESRLDQLLSDYKIKLNEFSNNYINSEKEFKSELKTFTDLTEIEIQKSKKLQIDQSELFSKYISQCEEEIANIEKQYGELMKFKKPAEYWNALSDNYDKSGNKWKCYTFAVSGVFILVLATILYYFPEWLKGSYWTLDHVKGVIIIGVIISVFSYVISLLAKLTLSSFHLSRDARERHQLTYVYLSMISEKAVSEKDRQIVLQSIFSRADTGLLKNDSSPTMPTIQSVVETVSNAGKNKPN